MVTNSKAFFAAKLISRWEKAIASAPAMRSRFKSELNNEVTKKGTGKG